MDKRSKILAGLFGAALGYAVLAGAVYPRWIKPLLTLDERIVDRQKVLDKLLVEDEAVQQARLDYKALAGRVGGFDPASVETNVRDRINQLIEKHKLADASVIPSRPVEDRKTGLHTSSITVSATGTLDATVAYLKDIAELPDLIRTGNVSLTPAGGGRKADQKDQRLNLRVPIDVWVLPQQRVVGPLPVEELTRPEQVVRHAGADYAPIVASKCFWDYVPPVPLRATIAGNINVEVGAPSQTLQGNATGGDGEYTFSWSPSTGLSDPTSPRPTVDTSTVGTTPYTLTVTDGTGQTATASTTVVVREKAPQVVRKDPEPPPPPPPPPGPKTWPDAKDKEIRMALLRTMGSDRLDEFMVYNNKSRGLEYYKVGDEFDGGKLVYVHQLGGVVERAKEYFVYPLGMTLDRHMPAPAAADYPELQQVAEKIREAQNKPAPAPPKPEVPQAQGPAPELPKDEKAAPAEPGAGNEQTVKAPENAEAKPVEPSTPAAETAQPEQAPAQAEHAPQQAGERPADPNANAPKPPRGRIITRPGVKKRP